MKMHWYRDKIFPMMMKKNIGKKSILELRKKILSDAKGEILEIGIGEGTNLTLYPEHVDQITAVDNYIRKIDSSNINVNLIYASADFLPFDDNSFDTVVSTFVLCSVENLSKVLAEIYRVLKPGGQFVFLEHGKAKDKLTSMIQNMFNPFYNIFAYGCNINRQYKYEMVQCGFQLLKFECEKADIYPRVLTGYVYTGKVNKPEKMEKFDE